MKVFWTGEQYTDGSGTLINIAEKPFFSNQQEYSLLTLAEREQELRDAFEAGRSGGGYGIDECFEHDYGSFESWHEHWPAAREKQND